MKSERVGKVFENGRGQVVGDDCGDLYFGI